MPLLSESIPRPPGDFADALATPEPVLLAGDQAINLWALYNDDRTQQLAPFVSRDVDILGDRQTLTDLANTIGTKPQFFRSNHPRTKSASSSHTIRQANLSSSRSCVTCTA